MSREEETKSEQHSEERRQEAASNKDDDDIHSYIFVLASCYYAAVRIELEIVWLDFETTNFHFQLRAYELFFCL